MQVSISHKKAADADKIDELVRCIAERFDPDQIILFGSHARGTARHDSDVDLLVVMPVTGSKARDPDRDPLCAPQHPCCKGYYCCHARRDREYGNIVGTIIRPALREGKDCMPEAHELLRVARRWVQKADNDLKNADIYYPLSWG